MIALASDRPGFPARLHDLADPPTRLFLRAPCDAATLASVVAPPVVAIVGAPNAGKSTLVNRLVGAKVTIVSPKAQTTRARVTGVAIDGPVELILVDTPGIFAPRRRLDRAMVDAAWRGAADADATLLLVDARRGLDEGVDLRQRGLISRGLALPQGVKHLLARIV